MMPHKESQRHKLIMFKMYFFFSFYMCVRQDVRGRDASLRSAQTLIFNDFIVLFTHVPDEIVCSNDAS